MIPKIKQFFNSHIALDVQSDKEDTDRAIQLATAALLIEVSRADYELDEAEQDKILTTLSKKFELSPTDLSELVELAEEELHTTSSLYQFTRLVNDNYSYDSKMELICSMWDVAYADGNLDKYEEYLIRKVAELIYVEHNDFIRMKISAQAKLG